MDVDVKNLGKYGFFMKITRLGEVYTLFSQRQISGRKMYAIRLVVGQSVLGQAPGACPRTVIVARANHFESDFSTQ